MRVRDWLIALSALAATALAIFAIGGVPRWAQAFVAVLTAIAVGGTALSQRSLARISPLVALPGAAASLTALQLVLPEALSPTMAALRADGAELLDVEPWTAVTADAGATLASLVVLLTLLGLAAVALRIATSDRGRYRIVVAVAALCVAAALTGFLHSLLGIRDLYGLYEPKHADPIILGPLLNANSLACLTAMGALLCIGLSAHRRQPGWLRALWLLLALPCGAVTVGTVSRGGTLALLGGAIVTVALLVAQRFAGHDKSRRRRARFLANALPMGILAGCLLMLVIWSNAGNVERQLSQLSFDEVSYSRSKFSAWRSSVALLEETPWLGVGRGAFAATFTRHHEASGLATYAYLENEYIQAIVDWGIPGAIVLGLAVLWLAYTAARRWRDSSLAAGVLGALVVVAMQSNVDFGLQFLGLAAPVTVLAATVTYVPLRERHRPLLTRGVRIAHAVALLVGAVLLLSSITTSLDDDHRTISNGATLARVRESATRHPLDYYSYAVGAEILSRSTDPRMRGHAIRLLNHAMALHPTHPQLHRMAARMLHAQGFVEQSAIEYAAALRTTPLPKPLLLEIVDKFEPEQAATALPLDYQHPEVIVRVLKELKRTNVARIWLARILKLHPRASRPCVLLFTLAEAGDGDAAEIAGKRCGDHLPDYQSRVSLARMLAAKQRHEDAIRLLEDVETWQARRVDKIDAWLLLCDAHTTLGFIDEAKRCLRRLDASPDMLDERRADVIRRVEDINGKPRAATGSAAAP